MVDGAKEYRCQAVHVCAHLHKPQRDNVLTQGKQAVCNPVPDIPGRGFLFGKNKLKIIVQIPAQLLKLCVSLYYQTQ